MSIGKFEFMHGAALARLLRKDEPLTLTLIETNKGESWSAYKTTSGNTEINIYMKYSTAPKQTKSQTFWTFVFNQPNVLELVRLNKSTVSLILVCAQKDFSEPSELCWISNANLALLIDFEREGAQTITVRHEKGKSLRVNSSVHTDELIVNRDEIDKIKF